MMDHFVTWDYTLPPPPTLAKVKAIFFRFLTFLARDLRGLENIKVYFSFVNVSDSLGPSSEHISSGSLEFIHDIGVRSKIIEIVQHIGLSDSV